MLVTYEKMSGYTNFTMLFQNNSDAAGHCKWIKVD